MTQFEEWWTMMWPDDEYLLSPKGSAAAAWDAGAQQMLIEAMTVGVPVETLLKMKERMGMK